MARDIVWVQSTLKNGKPGKRWFKICGPEYTKLNKCDVCGFLSTPKKVHARCGIFGWNFDGPKDYTSPVKTMLCMGCWNKVRALHYRQQEIEDLRAFIRKLERTISNERKQNHPDNRKLAGLSRDDDGGR